MPVPWRVDDGDFSVAMAVGQPEMSFPFASEGDQTSFIRRQKFRQDGRFWRAAAPMSSEASQLFQSGSVGSFGGATSATVIGRPITNIRQLIRAVGGDPRQKIGLAASGGPSLTSSSRTYLIDEGPTRDIGNGIVEWWREYASLPKTRTTYTNIGYTEQIAVISGNLIEYSTTKAARIVWEYFTDPPPSLFAPRIVMLNGTILFLGGEVQWSTRMSGREYLAADQEIGIWRGQIYYRKSIYVKPGLSFTTT